MAADLETDDGGTRHLTDDELHAFYGLLSGAGNETVARFLGWAVTGLDQFPDAARRARRGTPRLIPERGRRDLAVGVAVGDPGAMGDQTDRVARDRDSARLEGRDAYRFGEPR